MVAALPLSFPPLPLPPSASPDQLRAFGRVVRGYNPATASVEVLQEIQDALYTVGRRCSALLCGGNGLTSAVFRSTASSSSRTSI